MWISQEGGPDTWISITFNAPYVVSYIRLMQRLYNEESFKDVKLTYSDGTSVQVEIISKH